jgi:hypothetical protein
MHRSPLRDLAVSFAIAALPAWAQAQPVATVRGLAPVFTRLPWHTDFASAAVEARCADKLLLVYFTRTQVA